MVAIQILLLERQLAVAVVVAAVADLGARAHEIGRAHEVGVEGALVGGRVPVAANDAAGAALAYVGPARLRADVALDQAARPHGHVARAVAVVVTPVALLARIRMA